MIDCWDIQLTRGDLKLLEHQRNRCTCRQEQDSSLHLSEAETSTLREKHFTSTPHIKNVKWTELNITSKVFRNNNIFMYLNIIIKRIASKQAYCAPCYHTKVPYQNKSWLKIKALTTPGRSQQVSSEAQVVLQTISKDCSWNWNRKKTKTLSTAETYLMVLCLYRVSF